MAIEHPTSLDGSATLHEETCPLIPNEHTLECQKTLKHKSTPLDKVQLAILCAVRLVDPIAFTQIFPYINQMMEDLHVTDDPSQVGFYSGLVESAFAITQLLSIYHWARLSDIIGRRPVIIIGTVGIAISSVMFGLSRSLVAVIVARGLAGVFCGNVAVIQSALAEITDSSNQAVAYPIYGLTWPLGVIIGPLLGGALSKPATTFSHRLFQCEFLQTYPYFLPCAVSAAICLLGGLLAVLYLQETLPSKKVRRIERDYSISYGTTEHNDDMIRDLEPPNARAILSLPIIRAICNSVFALSFVETGFEVLLVLFCYSPIRNGGLSFSPSEIGYSFVICGSISAAVQVFIMPIVLLRFNATKVYTFCMSLWAYVFVLMPLLNVIARNGIVDEATNAVDIRTKALVWVGLAVTLAISRIGCIAYSLNMILVKDNAPSPAALGTTNGIATFAQCFARAIAPAFASSLFAFSVEKSLLRGYVWVIAMAGISIYGCVLSMKIQRIGRQP